MVTVFQKEWFLHIPTLPKKLKIHIKIDTGMGRLGVYNGIRIKQPYSNHSSCDKMCVIDGVFTHFATADEEDVDQFTSQLEKFKTFLATLS